MRSEIPGIQILYEDETLLALYKPAGLIVHSDGRTKEPSLSDWLMEKYPDIKKVGEPWRATNGEIIWRPGIVHRLDRDTSGAILIAKTPEAFEYLKKQFQERRVKKTYRAFVYGIIKPVFVKGFGEAKEALQVIDKPIGRSRNDFRKWSAEYGARGDKREAVTTYKTLARGNEATYIEAYPETGRTHQIRVHMKAVGHPVVHDTLYAPKGKEILGFKRLALHSFSIDVVTPSHQVLHIEAPLPQDFKNAEKILKE
ncbi:MAG: RluA family pseudouridine synthase [Candidatus Paceibacterota bacterium]|jgi:23S rRNA pseudouridine1911/1915/1917 synthase|nr:RluA family pseudouridine synthase [Candidatus Paceibacterota bacterium]